MKICVFGVRFEVCWEEDPDEASDIDTAVWLKTSARDAQIKEYGGIVASARRTGLYL